MGTLKEDYPFISARIAVVQYLGMGVVDHAVVLGRQKQDMPILSAACQIFLNFQFLGVHIALLFDVSGDDAEETGEHALKKTIERHAHLRLRQLLAGGVETGKGRISNHHICLFAQKTTHCPHTPPPHRHLKPTTFDEPDSDIHLLTLVFTQ